MALDICTHLPYIRFIDNGNTPTRKDEAMTLSINYVVYADHLGDIGNDEDLVETYAEKLEEAIRAEYPEADVEVEVKYNVSGVGSGASISYDDDDYHGDEKAIRANVEHISETVFQSL